MYSLRKKSVTVLLMAALLLGILLAGVPDVDQSSAKSKQGYDIILKNGTIIDGTGKDRYAADVGINDGYITSIGDLDRDEGTTEIDATGKIVSPGFIDIHSHADTSVLTTAKSSITQGVTTELLSPDGGGPVDLEERHALEEEGLTINIGSYIGFNAVWEEVVGFDDRPATEEEIAEMQSLIENAMKDGAWGVSAGLFYTPGNYAKTEEVIDVVSAAEQWRTNFPNHIRNENTHVVEATVETIEIGEGAGLVPVVTHMKVMGPNNWGKSEETIRLIQEANERGTFAAADQYPYLASQTGLTAIVPSWVQSGGRDAMLERFADPELRPQIEEEIHEIIGSRVQDANDVYFPTERETLQDIADERNVSPGEATMQILEEDGNLRSIYFFGDQEDFERILENPTTAIASDGGATDSDSTHPRHYGTQPRVLGKLVREDGLLSLEEAVMKMTGLPANIIGMVDRGFIAEGMVADITVFDEGTVIDKADFDDPKQYAEGIEQVLVNGEFALKDGELTGNQPGQALKRSDDMPSRPMSLDEEHQVKVVGKIDQTEERKDPFVHIKVDQEKHDSKPKGTFRLIDKENGLHIKSKDIGLLQTYNGWASFTGTAKLKNAETVPVLIKMDEVNPFTGMQTINIQVGDHHYEGEVKGKMDIR